MIKDKKIMVITTTDNMIWQFLLPHIKYLQEQGNEIECVCARTGFWFEELQTTYGLTVHEINFKRNPINFANLKAYKKLKQLQKERKFDLIYCQQPVGGFMGRLIAKKFKIPAIYTAHGFHFYKGCPFKNKLIFKTVEKWASKYTDALITINQEDYESALTFKAKSVHKINGIGVDLSKYKKVEIEKSFATEIGVKENDFVIVSIGELNENKNHKVVLEAVSKLKNKNFKYLICGQGPRKEEYEKFIKENNLEENVKLLGFRKDIPEILSMANVFVMPSFREGLPKSIMEAMCVGMPIIASKIRGCSDLVDEGKGGYLCEPNSSDEFKQAIEKIMDSKERQQLMSDYNLERVKDYSIETVLKQLEEIYNSIEI